MKKTPPIDARLLMGDITDLVMPRPEFEKVVAMREKAGTCVAFVSYLQVMGCVILPPNDYPATMRDYLCQFFGIQESVLQQEKLSLIGASCPEKRK